MTRRFRLFGCAFALLIAVASTGLPLTASAASGPNDTYFRRQWGIKRIGAPAAWKISQGKGVTIAIVDTGVRRNHEDLAANMAKDQYNAINNDNQAFDVNGHGTAMSGVAAAVTNNRKGIVGVAPKAKIMSVRAFGPLQGAKPGDVAAGIMWAADHGAKVINLSLGGLIGGEEDPALLYALGQGALIAASAGNGGEDKIGDPLCAAPAQNPATLCVGASDELDGIASFSNYGVRLDVVAPGVGIYTTDRTGFYQSVDGTSPAAAFVSGLGALLMSVGATNIQAANIIRVTAKDLGLPGYDITYGWGRIDAKAAVTLCSQIC